MKLPRTANGILFKQVTDNDEKNEKGEGNQINTFYSKSTFIARYCLPIHGLWSLETGSLTNFFGNEIEYNSFLDSRNL